MVNSRHGFLSVVYFVLVIVCANLGAMSVYGESTGTWSGSADPDQVLNRPSFMSSEKYQRLRSLLPEVSDPRLQSILQHDRLILYTDQEMPKAYQDWDGGLQGIHSPEYNISANGREPHGNANVEFPWGTPAGTHRAKNVTSFRFLWLPTDENGDVLPVTWYRWHYPGDRARGYEWIFPVGAVVGEVLAMRGPDGEDYTFEIRIRVRDYGEWLVDVFRPFPTADRLADRIKQLDPKWSENAELATLVEHLETPRELSKRTLADDHGRQVFVQTMGVDSLPPVGDDQLVVELLTQTTFRSALDTAWRHGTNGAYASAPTTKAHFHIIPAGYDGGFVDVDPVSCMRCHDTVGEHAQSFDFGRDWYGRVRGSDGIFSFHPFSSSSISYNGFGRPVTMRQDLLDAAVLERYDSEKHPPDVYQRLDPTGS